MRRIGLAVVLAVSLLAPLAETQQAGKARTLGILSPYSAPPPEQRGRGLIGMRLKELGWIEGQSLLIESAFAEGREDRLPELAEMLVHRRVDVIWTVGPSAAVAAARATKTIPIVFWGVGSPVEMGLISGFARPGGNVTGVAFSQGVEIIGKQLEFLKQISPGTKRLAWISDPEAGRTVSGGEAVVPPILEDAARILGLEIRRYPVRRPEDFDAVFAAAVAWRVQGLGAYVSPLLLRERKRIVEFANRHRLPSSFGIKDFVEVGGLLSYAPDTPTTVLQSVVYIDRILRGTRPADLPVEQPTKFELVINLKTATALGLTIPQSLLVRADEIIQ
jgi:putative tryptophan/tyrosine transport system substrate-binding protein